MSILTFEEALGSYNNVKTLDKGKWIYVPGIDLDYRYILGTVGSDPVITIGINPSTATPEHPDNTIKSVKKISIANGFDSFVMFNVYPQRATNPDLLDKDFNKRLHTENLKAFNWLLERAKTPPYIWAAWGNLIEKRPYLKSCLFDLFEIAKEYNVTWLQAGKPTKKSHPHHPLYLRSEEPFYRFDVEEYLNTQRE